MLTAAELHRRGLDETNAGRHARARSLFRRALERNPDTELTARIQLSYSHAQFELGSTPEALSLCERALAAVEPKSHLCGLIHSQLGVIHMRAGAGSEALADFGTALQLLDSAPEPQATAYLNRGNVYLQRGDIPRASADFEMAMSHARDGGLGVIQAKAEHNLGYTGMLAGDLVSALTLMDKARDELATLSPVYAAVCDQDRAEVLVAAGMTHDAAEALQASVRAFGSRRMRQRQGEAEVVLARLMLRENPSEAAKIARHAHRSFQTQGSQTWALRAEAIELKGRFEAGETRGNLLGRAAEVVVQLGACGLPHEASSLTLQIVRATLQSGDVAGAEDRMRGLHASRSSPLPTKLLEREVRSSLAQKRHRRRQAVDHVRRGLAELHEWQSSFGSLDLQSSLVGHGRRLARQGLALAIEDGRPQVVFEWSERARALAGRVTPLRPPADPSAAADLTELRTVQADLAADTSGKGSATLRRRANELRHRIRQRQWYDAGSGLVTEPASLDELVASLETSDGVLVAFIVVDQRLHALVVTASGATTRDLGDFGPVRHLMDGMQADLDMAATHHSAHLRAVVQSALDGRLHDLADHLVGPIVDDLRDRPVVVVPSGALAGVPWTLLPGLTGRPLTVPRSASSWLRVRERRVPLGSAGFVAGPRVHRAAEEVDRAAKAWDVATVLAGADARATAVGGLASSVDVFHVAAHGRHSADNPLFSGLELSDGPWFGYDIDQLAAIPSTVILSACELGRSSVRWGEETIGMTVAWLHAGVQTVIASPASVDDDVACAVLAATHHYLAVGESPSQALASATSEVGGAVPAPFVCFGSGW